jgi:hypothetical protein
MAALGGTLFKWQHREQRKGGSRVGGHVGVGEEGRGGGGLHSDRQRGPACSGPQPMGTGSGAVARTGESGGAWPTRCGGD